MKHILKPITLILIFVMIVMLPLEVFATTKEVKYVSELVTVTADSEDDAKKKFDNTEYKLVPKSNLNKTLKKGVYLGYKETTKKEEAITDIAAMNMCGNYSFSEADKIINEHRGMIEEYIKKIEKIIKNYQQCCCEKMEDVVYIYKALNMFVNDDDKENIIKMGDYFKEYCPEKDRENLTNMLLQANGQIVLKMVNIMSMVGDESSRKLFERISENSIDLLCKKCVNCVTEEHYVNELARKYGEVANKLGKTWDELYNRLSYIKEYVSTDPETKELVLDEKIFKDKKPDFDISKMSEEKECFFNVVNEIDNISEKLCIDMDFELYKYLSEHEFVNGTSMIETFCCPSSEVRMSDLYVIVDSMSDIQKIQADSLGITEILEFALPNMKKIDEVLNEELYETKDDSEKNTENDEVSNGELDETKNISIFLGVDRNIFKKGVAYTDDNIPNNTTNNEGFANDLAENILPITRACLLGIIGGAIATGVCVNQCKVAATKIRDLEADIVAKERQLGQIYENSKSSFYSDDESEVLYEIANQNQKALRINENIAELKDNMKNVKSSFLKFSIASAVCIIITVVSLVFEIIALTKYLTKKPPQEKVIPHYIMTPVENNLAFYNSVKTLNGEISDVNNHEANLKNGSGWLVLYTTTDPNAGNPICADSIRVINDVNDKKKDEFIMHPFNNGGGLSTIDPQYTNVNTKDHTYIVYTVEKQE